MKFLHALAIELTLHSASAIGMDEYSHDTATLMRGLVSSNISSDEAPPQNYPSVLNGGCDEAPNLDQFPQWREEVGYWVGELSFYGPDGTPSESANWNYRYDNYKSFITGNVVGGSYRQRNVFLYPPQTEDKCLTKNTVSGNGTCGTNGNSKIFFADQSNVGQSCDGTIEGPFGQFFDTNTTLVGANNAILYQVFFGDKLFQSQMTTLSGNGRRTRTAHGFSPFTGTEADSVPVYASFYRESRVEKEEFYTLLEDTLGDFNILDEDACTRDSEGTPREGIVGGIGACEIHLEESFSVPAEGLDGDTEEDDGDDEEEERDGTVSSSGIGSSGNELDDEYVNSSEVKIFGWASMMAVSVFFLGTMLV